MGRALPYHDLLLTAEVPVSERCYRMNGLVCIPPRVLCSVFSSGPSVCYCIGMLPYANRSQGKIKAT
jgi:hypothetical protein